MRRYSDDQLLAAINGSRSWRGVLRSLGLRPTSAGSMRSVRAHAERMGLDFSHFTAQRRWSDRQLAAAVSSSENWTQVVAALGLADNSASSSQTLRGHALRLGLSTEHLEPKRPPCPASQRSAPETKHLARAGALLAAAWFEMCGVSVSWPLEPSRFDLVIWEDAHPQRIQVKTTRTRDGSAWRAALCTHRKEIHTYGPDEIDQFFIIDGDLNYYLIPLAVVGGLKSISLTAYAAYQVPARPVGSSRRP